MADYRQVARHFPPVRDYIRNRRWVRRGDVVAYAPDQRTTHFSTDAFGFRHSVHRGISHSIADADRLSRYGLVLGSSHVFGFGLEGNEQTIASRLGEELGFPILCVCYPEADSRTLFATLLRILSEARTPPHHVTFFNGGDGTRFCYTGQIDPLFGSPDFERPIIPWDVTTVAEQSPRLAFFSNFWTRQALSAATGAGSLFLLPEEATFFEKSAPDPIERACRLGIAAGTAGMRFATQRAVYGPYNELRRKLLADEAAPLHWRAGFDDYLYIDEFHYRSETIALMARQMAETVRASGKA